MWISNKSHLPCSSIVFWIPLLLLSNLLWSNRSCFSRRNSQPICKLAKLLSPTLSLSAPSSSSLLPLLDPTCWHLANQFTYSWASRSSDLSINESWLVLGCHQDKVTTAPNFNIFILVLVISFFFFFFFF